MVSLENSKTFSSCKEDRKGQEDYNHYPVDFNEMKSCNRVNLFPSALANFKRLWAPTTGH